VTVTVSSALVRDWAYRALSGLGDARADIDALNVFPVPDGDTGTNLYLTMEAACQSVDECWAAPETAGLGSPGLGPVATAFATGALMGARGNSGVILSQILRGTSEVLGSLTDGQVLDGVAIHALLARGADLSYQAVARPVEGTILTVARAAADAAQAALDRGVADADAVVTAASAGAHDMLDRTPEMLETLRLAGVVDAGGRGLTVVLDALVEVVSGVPWAGPATSPHLPVPRPHDAAVTRHYGGPAYEVMFLLDAADEVVPDLMADLDGMGDSLVVVGGDRLWNVHVHVDDAGAAIEAAIAVGRPYRLRITHLDVVTTRAAQADQRALVAVTHGPGVAELLGGVGVFLVPARATQRPSTAELLEAIRHSHAAEVVVLPSDKDTRAVAETAAETARAEGFRVAVIPTRSIVQTLAAVAVHDPALAFPEDVISMTRAAGATRYAAITIASRRALTTVGPCDIGDVLGLVGGDIVLIGSDVGAVARDVLSGMLAIEGELVTLVLGADADDDLRVALPEWLAERFPIVELSVHDGGQPLWPLILGVE